MAINIRKGPIGFLAVSAQCKMYLHPSVTTAQVTHLETRCMIFPAGHPTDLGVPLQQVIWQIGLRPNSEHQKELPRVTTLITVRQDSDLETGLNLATNNILYLPSKEERVYCIWICLFICLYLLYYVLT